MTERAGVLRSRDRARRRCRRARRPRRPYDGASADVAAWETTNLLTVATALLDAAPLREETRGSHWREDFPDRDDEHWARHVDVTLDDGVPRLGRPAPSSPEPLA